MTLARASPIKEVIIRYANILSRFYATPLAIEINQFLALEALLLERSTGATLTAEAAQAWQAYQYGAASKTRNPKPSQIAIVGLYGPMLSHASAMNSISGATSTRQFAAMVNEAASNPNVGHIILDIASGGGEVGSVDVAVNAVREAKALKPVTAVTEDIMASAAYWVGSQADRVIASPNAMVGSISVVYTHTDRSQANEQAGIRRTILTTGDKKTVGSPDAPLDEASSSEIMRLSQQYHDQFVQAVALGRGRDASHVQSTWADGRVETGVTAKQLGLVDDTGTLSEVINDVASGFSAAGERLSIISMSDLKIGGQDAS